MEYNLPDERGHFGEFGGRYTPEMLYPALQELTEIYARLQPYRDRPKAASEPPEARFWADLDRLNRTYCGRPTPLYFAETLTREWGGAKVYLKLESLAHTGAHKINNALGQALLARDLLGKRRVIAETGAGQHGLASATAAARLGLECTVHMGEVDLKRQAPNVFWMRLLGAEVRPVTFGQRTLKDAVTAAMNDWMERLDDSHYLLGSALGPHPYPTLVRDFQSVIGREVKAQLQEAEGRLPDYLVACVGGGSNAMGLWFPFLEDGTVQFVGVEAGGLGIDTGRHAARFADGRLGRPGVVEGYRSFFLQDEEGQLLDTHSISAGLDYPGVGPELSYLKTHQPHRTHFVNATDEEALQAFRALARAEGIVPALESAHALAHARCLAPTLGPEQILVVNISGRGDKDLFIAAEATPDAAIVLDAGRDGETPFTFKDFCREYGSTPGYFTRR
jgi:tryptophan synthase beta chain